MVGFEEFQVFYFEVFQLVDAATTQTSSQTTEEASVHNDKRPLLQGVKEESKALKLIELEEDPSKL